ncbi:hypothetical protein pipiens_009598 [Culex pipiens pipiens]|uniref:Secreted protein n=1 Tax=Culex pipiens pipiens TaxID=38569 RepID=A0ABD1DF48_CULPP
MFSSSAAGPLVGRALCPSVLLLFVCGSRVFARGPFVVVCGVRGVRSGIGRDLGIFPPSSGSQAGEEVNKLALQKLALCSNRK